MLLILTQVHPVDAPPKLQFLILGQSDAHCFQVVNGGKGHLKANRLKIAFFYLLCQGPDGPVRDPLDPSGQIGVAG